MERADLSNKKGRKESGILGSISMVNQRYNYKQVTDYKFHQQVAVEIYQETTKQTKAIVQLDCEGWGLLLQQIHPLATFIVIWAIIRDTAAVKPRPRAGLLGYEHWVAAVISTSEPCKMKNSQTT